MGSGTVKQFIAAFAAGMPALLFGAVMAWPSYTLKVLADNSTSPLQAPLSDTHESLLGCLPSVGALLGSCVGGLIIERLGRRNGALFIGISFVLAWCCKLVAWEHWLLHTGRVLSGLGGGAGLVLAPVFISETAEERLLGALAASTVWMYCLGVLVSYALGWLCSYRAVVLANLTLSAANIALMALLRETPLHLLKNNLHQEALESLAFYRGLSVDDKDVLTEMSSLRARLHEAREMRPILATGAVESDAAGACAGNEKTRNAAAYEGDVGALHSEKEPLRETPPPPPPPPPPPLTGWRYLRADRGSRRALALCATFIGLQTWMGILAVQVYAGRLFSAAAPGLSPDLCSVLLAAVMILGALAAGALVDRAGRRLLLAVSSLLASACLLALGSLLQYAWAPPAVVPLLIFAFCFVFSAGPGTVPYVLLAEFFVQEVQSACTTLVMCVQWLMNFALLGVFPPLASALGVHGAFYAFGAVAAATGALALLVLPETGGLTATQIQRLLASPPHTQ